jgi:hypothetical protein
MQGRKEERFDSELAIMLDGGGIAVARNVSASGVYFVTDVALEAAQLVRFSLEFLDFPSGPIVVKCSARIVRVEERGVGRGVAASISSFEFRRMPMAGKSSH